MTVILDSSSIPLADRADVLRQTVTESVVQVGIDFAPGLVPAAAGRITKLGPLTICSVRSNAVAIERTRQLAAADDLPSIFVGLQLTGSSLIAQHGREAVLRPGQMVIYDTTEPYVLLDSAGFRQHFFRIPLDRLGLPHDLVHRISAVSMGPEHPVVDLTVSYLRHLAERSDRFSLPGADAVSRPSIDLVRAAITSQLGVRGPSNEQTQALRITEYARSHLRDPDLGATRIAAALHISSRQVYKVLFDEGLTLGDWIRRHRLEECRRELADPRSPFTSIGAVARYWGFADPSTFSRAFRAAYGLTAREWRGQHVGGTV